MVPLKKVMAWQLPKNGDSKNSCKLLAQVVATMMADGSSSPMPKKLNLSKEKYVQWHHVKIMMSLAENVINNGNVFKIATVASQRKISYSWFIYFVPTFLFLHLYFLIVKQTFIQILVPEANRQGLSLVFVGSFKIRQKVLRVLEKGRQLESVVTSTQIIDVTWAPIVTTHAVDNPFPNTAARPSW